MKLRGKVAIVTGAARGIGLACARRFAEEGARVLLSDVNQEALATATALLAAEGHAVASHVADVADRRQVEHMVQAAADRFGRLDIMLNNAGIDPNDHGNFNSGSKPCSLAGRAGL